MYQSVQRSCRCFWMIVDGCVSRRRKVHQTMIPTSKDEREREKRLERERRKLERKNIGEREKKIGERDGRRNGKIIDEGKVMKRMEEKR